jgi:hypothetical protein
LKQGEINSLVAVTERQRLRMQEMKLQAEKSDAAAKKLAAKNRQLSGLVAGYDEHTAQLESTDESYKTWRDTPVHNTADRRLREAERRVRAGDYTGDRASPPDDNGSVASPGR